VIAQSAFDEGKVFFQHLIQLFTEILVLMINQCILSLHAIMRSLIPAPNAASQGYKYILIIANSTDFVVLAISFFNEIGAEKLWVKFGKGKKMYFHSQLIFSVLCLLLCKIHALPGFHTLAGCENTCFFFWYKKEIGISQVGHKTELTMALCHLMERPLTLPSEDIKVFEGFVVSLYSATSPLTQVNNICQQIFAQSPCTIEYLPPTKADLVEHIKRVTYQAGYVWGQSLVEQALPSIVSWGWVEAECGWEPFWTPLPQAAKALQGQVHKKLFRKILLL